MKANSSLCGLGHLVGILAVLMTGFTASAQTHLVSVKVYLDNVVVDPLYDEDGFLSEDESLEVTGMCPGATDSVSSAHTVLITTCHGDSLNFHVLHPNKYRTSPLGVVTIDHWEVDNLGAGSGASIDRDVLDNLDVEVFLTQTITDNQRDPVSLRWDPDAGQRSGGDLTWGPAYLAAKTQVGDVSSDAYPALLYSAEAFEKQVDFAVPGRGLDFVFSRVHRSGEPDGNVECFGGQWTHNFDIKATVPSSFPVGPDVKVKLGNGTTVPFKYKYYDSTTRYYYAAGWDAELRHVFTSTAPPHTGVL